MVIDKEILEAFHESHLQMNASLDELKQEMRKMKKRKAALERAFDSILTKDDILVADEVREDLRQGSTGCEVMVVALC